MRKFRILQQFDLQTSLAMLSKLYRYLTADCVDCLSTY